MTTQSRTRCAIYTRKSSEEGLEQDFNSIEAQREAGEAYIRSQAHEGWVAISERYDDGGFSGGNTSRPALTRLLEAVRAGHIDVLVIYKIDRLTRSLTDFARLAETFDEHGVSFVSVTQQFNTTNSMGRLMLNVLLSFAQFEREITGERIRDKFAASKKKGMWMGGPVPMGFEVRDRRLVIKADEAATVRAIFQRYLEERQVTSLLLRLKAEGVTTPGRVSAKGNASGNRPFTRGHLYKLLSNPIYVGRVQHRGETHPGQHEAIIDTKTWNEVQTQLAENTQGSRERPKRAEIESPLLSGLLCAGNNSRFLPTHTTKGARRYRYYVEEAEAGTRARRIPATEIERATIFALRTYLQDRRQLAFDLGPLGGATQSMLEQGQSLAQKLVERLDRKGREGVRRLLTRVIFRDEQLELQMCRDDLKAALGSRDANNPASLHNYTAADDIILVRAPLALKRRGSQLKLVSQPAADLRMNPDRSLVLAVARARDWAARILCGDSVTQIATDDHVTDGYVSQVLPLAFLAPALVEDVVLGRQGAALTANRLIWKTELPLSWREQKEALL
jgi:site-specific DNA recombinase